MDYFAVRFTVDESKQAILKDFVLQVYAAPAFQKFMADMGMAAWEADSSKILGMVSSQTEAMPDLHPPGAVMMQRPEPNPGALP